MGKIPLEPVCDWDGVQCDGDFRVTGLYMHQRNLEGTISPHINHLHRLRVLMLSENHLKGEIPAVHHLQHLQVFDLHDNDLHGRPPPSLLNLDNIVKVDVAGNSELTGQSSSHHYASGTSTLF